MARNERITKIYAIFELPKALFQSKSKCDAVDLIMTFYSHARPICAWPWKANLFTESRNCVGGVVSDRLYVENTLLKRD